MEVITTIFFLIISLSFATGEIRFDIWTNRNRARQLCLSGNDENEYLGVSKEDKDARAAAQPSWVRIPVTAYNDFIRQRFDGLPGGEAVTEIGLSGSSHKIKHKGTGPPKIFLLLAPTNQYSTVPPDDPTINVDWEDWDEKRRITTLTGIPLYARTKDVWYLAVDNDDFSKYDLSTEQNSIKLQAVGSFYLFGV